nr:MAG TPA: hypothetical protein [Caudoviricetes sp.]
MYGIIRASTVRFIRFPPTVQVCAASHRGRWQAFRR